MSRTSVRAAVGTATVAALVLAACGTDAGLVDRVAAIEQDQQELRVAVGDLGAGDPDLEAERERAATLLSTLDERVTGLEEAAARVDELEETVATLRADLDRVAEEAAAAATATTERVAAVEGRVGAVGASLDELESSLARLTDLVSSLRVQFDSHRDDPGAHAGAPGTP